MEKIFQKLFAALALSFIINTAGFSQYNNEQAEVFKAPWVSEKGYWVTESSRQDKKHHIIYFYTNKNKLIYKETLDGVKLNFNRAKTLMRLKVALETAVAKWDNARKPSNDVAIVANVFGLKKK